MQRSLDGHDADDCAQQQPGRRTHQTLPHPHAHMLHSKRMYAWRLGRVPALIRAGFAVRPYGTVTVIDVLTLDWVTVSEAVTVKGYEPDCPFPPHAPSPATLIATSNKTPSQRATVPLNRR